MNFKEEFLKSGLADRDMVRTLERWGYMEPGSSELVPEKTPLTEASKEQLLKFAERLEVLVDDQKRLKETHFNLDTLRWPVTLQVMSADGIEQLTDPMDALIDRMGRYYFRAQDAKLEWFTPGLIIYRNQDVASRPSPKGGHHLRKEVILEAGPLYIGDEVAAIQVTTQKL